MTLTVRDGDADTIALPAKLREKLNLRDGDLVTPILEGNFLRLTRVDRFLALRGALADDEGFDQAMDEVRQQWATWASNGSA